MTYTAVMIGEKVSKYQVIQEIGRGGMGVVFHAFDTHLRRDVALKVLSPDRAQGPRRRRRLVDEARAASSLDHPGIVTVFDILRHRDSDVIVMELVAGRSLRAELESEGKLPWRRAFEIGTSIAEAMRAAHRGGVVHRDLKPENLVLGPTGGVKVLDFGLAKLDPRMRPDWKDEETLLSSLESGFDIGAGTVSYMAPEQALGETVDARTDIFAWGVMLYEMLSGRRPFRGATPLASLQATVLDLPAPLEVSDLPPSLDRLVESCLAKRPADRPQSFDAVLETLGRLRDPSFISEEGKSRPSSPDQATTKRPRVSFSAWATAVFFSLLLILWISGLMSGAGNEATATSALNRRDGLGVTEGANEEPAGPSAAAAFPAYLQGRQWLERYDRPGHIDEAIESLSRAINKDPGLAVAYAALSEAFWRKYRVENTDPMWLDRAESHAQRALELGDHLAVAHIAQARVWVERADIDKAEQALDRASLLDPMNPWIPMIEARGHQKAQDPESAEAAYRRAIELDPARREAYDSLGSLLFRRARYEEAEAAFRQSLALAPDSYIGHRNLSGALQMQGHYGEAASHLQRSLEIRQTWSGYTNLGTLQFFRGLYDESVSAFEKAIELGANGYIAWANLGDAYRFSPAHREEAPAAFRRAIQLARERLSELATDAELRSRIALYHAKAGEGETALAELAKVDLSQADASLLNRSVLIHELAGNRQEALSALERTLKLGYPIEAIQQDPELEALRRDVKFHKLLAGF